MSDVAQTVLETEYRKHRIIIHCAPGGALITLLPPDGTHRMVGVPWRFPSCVDFTKLAFGMMKRNVDMGLDRPIGEQKLYEGSPEAIAEIRRQCADTPAHDITSYGAATQYKSHRTVRWGLVSIDTNIPFARNRDLPIDFPEGYFRDAKEDEMENLPPVSQPLSQHLN